MLPKTILFAASVATVAGFASTPTTTTTTTTNPCQDAPLRNDLSNIPCESAKVQSGANVTVGAQGLLAPDLDPIPLPLTDTGACAVNVHWHLGAEHYSQGQYDISPTTTGRRLAGSLQAGYKCPTTNDAMYTTEYNWQYCKDMHVGETYEFHWPHSNLGECGTDWQFQSHFLDGVLCAATKAGMTVSQAADAIFTSKTAKIGVMGQVFTIVNAAGDARYDYPAWNMLHGWNDGLATDVAVYQGSTTGSAANNDDQCRGYGGMVTWHQDRNCHKVSAKAVDELCRVMLTQSDDMSEDVEPHGARELVDPRWTTNVIMTR